MFQNLEVSIFALKEKLASFCSALLLNLESYDGRKEEAFR